MITFSNGMVRAFEKLRVNGVALTQCETAVEAMYRGGLLDFLRELGKPQPIDPSTPNYVAVQSTELNRCIGVNEAIDFLVNFRDILVALNPKEQVAPDFGALEKAVESQDLTEEEANAVRNNTPIPNIIRVESPDIGNSSDISGNTD